jgi:mRNA interferase HigB
MQVITRKRLHEFVARHSETHHALEHWYREMKRRNFGSFAELRSVFPAADQVGRLTVCNIGGNRVRLVAALHYHRRRVYIRAVLTPGDYDAGTWKE